MHHEAILRCASRSSTIVMYCDLIATATAFHWESNKYFLIARRLEINLISRLRGLRISRLGPLHSPLGVVADAPAAVAHVR